MRPEDEPSDEAASTPLPESAGAKRSRAFMKAARKDLSEEDLSTPAARRFLLDELERLDIEVSELQEFRCQTARKRDPLWAPKRDPFFTVFERRGA
jgi:hypothetical protein